MYKTVERILDGFCIAMFIIATISIVIMLCAPRGDYSEQSAFQAKVILPPGMSVELPPGSKVLVYDLKDSKGGHNGLTTIKIEGFPESEKKATLLFPNSPFPPPATEKQLDKEA